MSLARNISGALNPNWRGGGRLRSCRLCGGMFRDPRNKAAFCSERCREAGRTGSLNPNYRGASERVCVGCGATFHSYNKTRKYCCKPCHVAHRVVTDEMLAAFRAASQKAVISRRANPPKRKSKPKFCKECGAQFMFKGKRLYCDEHQHIAKSAGLEKAQAAEKVRAGTITPCRHCGEGFYRYPKSRRKFCSYECHLASGGAIRAGLAAVRASQVYGTKKDANHREIVDAISKAGVPFIDMSALGCGVPDLLVDVEGSLQLWEIKNKKTSYGRKGLNKNQEAWAKNWKGSPVRLIYSVEDALQAVGLKH